MFFEKVKSLLFKSISLLIIIIILTITIIAETGYIVYAKNTNKKDTSVNTTESIAIVDNTVKEDKEEKKNYNVDIKGAVKNPGVYNVDNESIINDVITVAGGLNKNAYTNNINLSKKISDEMVIYIYTSQEFKKLNVKEKPEVVCETKINEVNNCIEKGNSVIETNVKENNTITETIKENTTLDDINKQVDTTSSELELINLNTATKEELMTLTGIGEAKAEAIIQYRNEHGHFVNIEDIKNVSGIGDALFDKIKEFITV